MSPAPRVTPPGRPITRVSRTSRRAPTKGAAPRMTDAGARPVAARSTDTLRWTSAFDQVWQTLKSLYYGAGESAASWDALRAKYLPRAAASKDAAAAEDVIDAMIAEQPMIK